MSLGRAAESTLLFPSLHYHWLPFVPQTFAITSQLVGNSLAENYKNDLFWLIALRAVKVRYMQSGSSVIVLFSIMAVTAITQSLGVSSRY